MTCLICPHCQMLTALNPTMTHLSPEWRQKLLEAGFPADELRLGVAEEILARLPARLDGGYPIAVFRDHKGWCVWYLNEINYYADSTLANAAAAMYYYLSEHHLLPQS